MYQPTNTLTVINANANLEDGLRSIAEGQTEINFAEVSTVDSTAVATMLAWQRAANKKGATLTFSNLPANLISLIDLYSLNGLLHH